MISKTKLFILGLLIAGVAVCGFGWWSISSTKNKDRNDLTRDISNTEKTIKAFEVKISSNEALTSSDWQSVNSLSREISWMQARAERHGWFAEAKHIDELDRRNDIVDVKIIMNFVRRDVYLSWKNNNDEIPLDPIKRSSRDWIHVVISGVGHHRLTNEEIGVTTEELRRLMLRELRKEATLPDGWNDQLQQSLDGNGEWAYETATKIADVAKENNVTLEEFGINIWLFKQAVRGYQKWHGDDPKTEEIDMKALGLEPNQ